MKKYQLTKITNSIYILDLPLDNDQSFTRSFIIKGDSAVLIDTGIRDSANDIVEAFDKVSLRMSDLKFIFNSHGHYDHIGSNQTLKQFSGALIVSSENAAVWIEDFDKNYNESYNLFPKLIGPSSEEKVDFYNKIGSPSKVDIKFNGELNINLGSGIILNVFPTPGHTDGDISFFEEKSKTLIIADALYGPGSSEMLPHFCHPKSYLKTLDMLEKMDSKTLLTSHFPVKTGEEVKEFFKETREYYRNIEKEFQELNKKTPGDLGKISKALSKKIKKKFSVQILCTVSGFLETAK